MALRVSASFVVPASLAPNAYQVVYCSADCTTGLGDLMGGTIYVDVAPPAAIPRDWPADDPAWALRGEAPPVPRPDRIVPAPQPNVSLGTSSGSDRSDTAATPQQDQAAPTATSQRDDAPTGAVVAVALVVIAAPVGVMAVRRRRKVAAITQQSPSEPAGWIARTALDGEPTEAQQAEHHERSLQAQR